MIRCRAALGSLASIALVVAPATPQAPDRLADAYVDAVRELNEDHVRKPGETREDELRAGLPKRARASFEKLLGTKKDGEELADALAQVAEAALDLALVDDFRAARERLARFEPERAARLGVALDRPRFLLRGLGGLDEAYLEHFAEVLDAVLVGYDELFGFDEWSKVPGKKLRVRVHLEERIERPPYFAPQFPWHSEIDFPVVDAERLRSPTRQGQFLFYGLCHELGHVIAMWGSRGREEDHHAWAHYTGVTLVEHLAAKELPCLSDARDARWRSLSELRAEVAGVDPSTASREAVQSLLVRLHDAVGPAAIGGAINHLDALDERARINHVRYYTFDELRAGLRAVLDGDPRWAAADALLQD